MILNWLARRRERKARIAAARETLAQAKALARQMEKDHDLATLDGKTTTMRDLCKLEAANNMIIHAQHELFEAIYGR